MPFELTIVTPQGEAYRGEVERVVLPGSEGEFGVLESHERFLSPLKIGALEIQTRDGSLFAAISDGFAEVAAEHVSVLVDSCELESEIDAAQADADLVEARRQLAEVAGDDTERYARFERALEHAHHRSEVAKKGSR